MYIMYVMHLYKNILCFVTANTIDYKETRDKINWSPYCTIAYKSCELCCINFFISTTK